MTKVLAEPRIMREPEKLRDVETYVANVARWLVA
jgi:hypothetical protein